MLKSLITEIFGVGPHPEDTIGSADRPDHAPGFVERDKRLVVIFPDANGVMADAQVQTLTAHRAGLDERDIAIVRIDGDDVHHIYGALSATPSENVRSRRDLVATLRHEMTVAPGDFTVLLVGKDGHVKSRSAAPVDPAALFAEIDAMPMRQAEMRRSSREDGM